jgi:hypothetical protein
MDRLTHSMNCPGTLNDMDQDCTCGLQWRIALQTERVMHAAWRKRAAEAEARVRQLEKLNTALSDTLDYFGHGTIPNSGEVKS